MSPPTALLIGRFQPFHVGHRFLAERAIADVGHVTFGVKDSCGDDRNPFTYEEVRERIVAGMRGETRFAVMLLPNLTAVYYGRDVGYSLIHVEAPPEVRAVSATELRRSM